ncbi:MAG TPA: SDR family oxidoreductase, partial [Polyangiaceae bacterium]|nr:SDR family oxidoreductase [Polyangiaceae bacterium]
MTWAVVTGASRGIGRATALGLAKRGLKLALVGRPSPELESSCAAVLAAGAPAARVWHADLSASDKLAALAAGLLATHGAPAVVVHNAGVVHRASVEAMSLELWRQQLEVNLTAPFALTHGLLPAMRAAAAGRIIHVGSISSSMGTAQLSAYCAAKWGLIGYMKSLAEELSDSG